MIIKAHALPVTRQAQLLDISRSNVYYLPVPTSEKDLALMRAIDELHLEYPFLGARQLRKILAREGHPRAGRLHIGTLMQKMGITALYRKPNTSKRHPAHKVYPYLLRHLAIEQANHVWAMDISVLQQHRRRLHVS
jgi:putative transposase